MAQEPLPRAPLGAPARRPHARGESAMAVVFALGVLCLYLASAGGRIVASDEHTVFRLTQSLVERGSVAVPDGNAERGPDGRLYAKAGLGQALASVPFYALGKLTAPLVPERVREFYVRAATSLVMPFAGALVALALVLLGLELGLGPRQALGVALIAALGTPLWVYSKLYLAEALLAAGLALELLGVARWRRGGEARDGALAAVGFGLAVLTKYAALPMALALLVPAVTAWRRWKPALAFLLVAGACVGVAMLYNLTRTDSPWGSGYGRQATAAAFTTPLLVGLYGLLLSAGKGLAWFAPVTVLAPAGFAAWWRSDRWTAAAAAAGVGVTVLLYAGFEHWAGDGSWGPRYLVPLLPVLVAAVAARLARRAEPRRRLWWAAVAALGLAGAAVQAGGVAVYFGSQMREAGDYPYRLPLDHPRFLSESHWNPYYSPIAAHWRMAARNADEHRRGRAPRLRLGAAAATEAGPAAGADTVAGAKAAAAATAADSARTAIAPPARPAAPLARLGIDEAQARALTHGFDLWPAYAIYVGLPAALVLAVWIWLLVAGAGCLAAAWRDGAALTRAAAVRGPGGPGSRGPGRPKPDAPPPLYVPPEGAERGRWSMSGRP